MQLLDEIIELTADIEQRVLAADWAGAASVDRRRRMLLARLFDGEERGVPGAGEREVLEQLLARNDQVIGQVSGTREALQTALRQLNDAPAAMRAYERNSLPAAAVAARSEVP